MAQLYSGKGAGAAAHLDLKKQVRESTSTQKNNFLNYIINDLWGILS